MCFPANATMSEDSEALVEAAIPGLDFSDDKTGNVVDVGAFLPDTKSVIIRRKPIYTKPVPRAFERAWAEGRETSAVKSNSHSSRPQENSTGLLGESPGQQSIVFFLCSVSCCGLDHAVRCTAKNLNSWKVQEKWCP